jgi:hypothetical protein
MYLTNAAILLCNLAFSEAMISSAKSGKISAITGNGDGLVAIRSRTPFGTELTSG